MVRVLVMALVVRLMALLLHEMHVLLVKELQQGSTAARQACHLLHPLLA